MTKKNRTNQEKITIYEALSVQCLRMLEQRTRLETKAVQDLDPVKDEKGRLRYPLAFLVKRAECLLSRYHLSPAGFHASLSWFFLLGFILILCLGIGFYPLAKASNILGDRLANLAGPFIFFLLLQEFFLILSLVFFSWTLLLTLFHYFWPGHSDEDAHTGWIYTISSLIGSIIITVTKFLYHLPDKLRWKKQSSSDEKVSVIISDCIDYIIRKRQPLLLLSGFFSHTFWLVMSIALLVCLLIQMQGNEYRYCWESSITSIDDVRYYTDLISRPFPHAARPNEEDINSLFDRTAERLKYSKNVIEKEDGGKQSIIRRHWSLFVLCCILFYCIFPRAFLAFAYYRLFCHSLNAYRPQLDDEYFAAIIEEEENRLKLQTVYFNNEENDENMENGEEFSLVSRDRLQAKIIDELMTEYSGEKMPLTEEPLPEKPLPEQLQEPVPEPLPEPDRTLVFGYDAEMNEADWKSLFSEDTLLYIFGNVVRTREEKKQFQAWLIKNGSEVIRCVLLVNSSFSPARQELLFFQDIIKIIPQASFYFILSNGEELRQKFQGNCIQIQERLNDWDKQLKDLEKIGKLSITIITNFDHLMKIPASEEHLRQLFQEVKTLKINTGNKLEAALTLICNEVAPLFSGNSVSGNSVSGDEEAESHQEMERGTHLYNGIKAIYREEEQTFLTRCRNVFGRQLMKADIPAEVIRQYIPDGSDIEQLQGRILPAVEMMEKTKRLFSKLGPRCAIAGAVLGVSLPLTAAVVPLMGGAVTISALTSLGSLLPSVLASGGTGALVGSLIPFSWKTAREKLKALLHQQSPLEQMQSRQTENSEVNWENRQISIQTLVCSGALWAILFELQGLSENIIVERLPVILAPLDESPLDSLKEIKRALEQVRKKVREGVPNFEGDRRPNDSNISSDMSNESNQSGEVESSDRSAI